MPLRSEGGSGSTVTCERTVYMVKGIIMQNRGGHDRGRIRAPVTARLMHDNRIARTMATASMPRPASDQPRLSLGRVPGAGRRISSTDGVVARRIAVGSRCLGQGIISAAAAIVAESRRSGRAGRARH
jgi:hypothetical protein